MLIFTVLMMLYFGVIRLLDSKKKEFLQFLVMYLFALSGMVCLNYIFAKGATGLAGSGSMLLGFLIHISGMENIADVKLYYYICAVALFCFCPTFVASYLLYPFKTMKRNKVLIWVLSIISALILGIEVLVNIAVIIGVMFSNM